MSRCLRSSEACKEMAEALANPPVVLPAEQRALAALKREEAKDRQVKRGPADGREGVDAEDADPPAADGAASAEAKDPPVYHIKVHKRKTSNGNEVKAYAICKSGDTKKKTKQVAQLLSTVVESAHECVQSIVERLNNKSVTEDQALQELTNVKAGKS